MIAALPKTEPRYVVYDFAFKTHDERDVEYLLYITWCPDETKIKNKMTYASNAEGFKK